MVIYLNVTEPFFAPKAINDQDRAALGADVDPVHSELKKKFDVKQVQLHLPPATSFLLIVAIAVFYFEYIPGKHGGISMKEDPFFFWGILLFCVGMAVNQLLTLESNQKKSDHDV